jgi:DNA-directed RNA polymerase subunit RPC12/RpoP
MIYTTRRDSSMDDKSNEENTETDPEDCTCGDCGICVETIGDDPEIPCPHCKVHGPDPW